MSHGMRHRLEQLRSLNDKDDIRQSLEEPSSGADVATLDPATTIPLSPMLRARFAFAGAWDGAALGQAWLGLDQIAPVSAFVRDCAWHIGHLATLSDAFPAPVGPSRISLYGLAEARGEATYLIWRVSGAEPAVCAFYGGGFDRFVDLSRFLAFLVGEQ